jgi:hypothetical protein
VVFCADCTGLQTKMSSNYETRLQDTIYRLQPVLMLGPRSSGKSTFIARVTDPVSSHAKATLEPESDFSYCFPRQHWPQKPEKITVDGRELLAEVITGLQFFDIPGEFAEMNDVFSSVRDRAKIFRQTSKQIGRGTGLGIVLAVFMGGCLDSQETTKSFYDQKFLNRLERQLMEIAPDTFVEDVIFIFNKWDLWYVQAKAAEPSVNASPDAMVKCLRQVYRVPIEQLWDLAAKKNSEKKAVPMCVATRLGRNEEDKTILNNAPPQIREFLDGMEDVNVSLALQSISRSYVYYMSGRSLRY